MRYEERRSSSRGRSSRGYAEAKNRYYSTRGNQEAEEDHFDSEESYRRERSIRYDRREDDNPRSRSPYGRSTHGRSVRDESDDYTPSSRSRSYRPSDVDRELARHDNGYRRNESPYRGRNNRDSPVSESSENQESYSDRVQRSGRMAPRMVDSSRNGRDYGRYNDNAYDDGYSRYSGTKSRSTSQSSDSYTTDDDDDYDANCMNTLFNGQEEGHGRSSGNILSYKKKGKNASELQLKMTLPLPLQLMDNLEKMVPSKSTIESALETFRVKGGKLAKKCELDYSRLEDQVIIDEEFAGGVMPQFHKALFEDQSEDTTDDVGNNIIHLNGRKMIPPGRPDETKSYSTGPRRPESLPGHVMVDEGITCVSSGPTDAFDEFHPETGHYQQVHTDYASRYDAGPDILRKINAGLAGSQGLKMHLGDEMERPSFDEGVLPSLSPRESQYTRATPKQRDALSKFSRRTEHSAVGKPWIPASKQPLDMVDQAYPSFDAPADEAIKPRGVVRQEPPIEPQSHLQFGVDGIPTAVGYGRNRDDRDMHTVCSDLTGDDELLYVEEIPIIKNLPVEHELEEPGEIPAVQPTRVSERLADVPTSESHDYRHFKDQPKTDVISKEQERTSVSHQWEDGDNLSRRIGSSRLRERRDLDVEILSERSVSRSRVGNRLSYQERSQFSNASRRGYQMQGPDEPSFSSGNRTESRSRTLNKDTESQNSETVQTKSEVHRSSSVSRSRRTRSVASSFDDAPMDEERSDNVNSRGAFSTRSGSSKETPSRSGRPAARTTLLATVSIGTPNDSAERNAPSSSCSVAEPEVTGNFDLRQRAAAARMEAMHGTGGANMKSPASLKKPFDEINEGDDELMMPPMKSKPSTTLEVSQKADPLGCRGAAPSSSFGDTTGEGPQQNLVDNVGSKDAEVFCEYNKSRASRNHIMDPEGDIPDNDTRLEPEGEIQTVVSDPATWCEETKVVSPEGGDGSAMQHEDQVIDEPDAENLTVKSADASENEEIINMERSVNSEERSERSKQASVTRFTPTQDMDEESQLSTPIQTPGGNRVYSEIDAMSQAVEVNYLGGLSVIASVAPTVSECEPPLAIAPTVETQGTHGQTTFSMDTPVQAPPAGTFDAYDRQHWEFSQPKGKLDTDDFYGGHEDDEEATQYHFDERQAKLSALLPARECGASKTKTRSLVLPQEFVAKAFTNMIALVVFFFTEWLRYLTFTYKRRPVRDSNPALPNFRGKDANRDVQTTNSEMIQGAPSYRRRRCGSDGLSIAIEPYVPEVQAAVVTPSSARSRSNLRPGVGSATYANIRQSFSRGDARSVASMQGWSAKPSPRVFDFCEE